jgi:D-alanyl-D-alanine carboxypeptidase/D-alanyl-D-alanine-endopeptidase (penicillin-binding protein 4)
MPVRGGLRWVAFVGLFVLSVSARAVDSQGRGTDAKLVQQVDTLLEEPGLKGGFQGVIVQSMDDWAVWYERNPELLFMPASNMKLLTSAAVLNALGPDWRFETVLLRNGSIDQDGTLHGSLFLKGSGDPLLSSADLDAMVEQVRGAGIRRVQGKLIGDDNRFDHKKYGRGWPWDNMPNYYSAPLSGLNLNGNLLAVTVDPGKKPGDPLQVSVAPTSKYARLTIRARTTEKGSKPALAVSRELGSNEVTVDGTLPVDSRSEVRKPVDVTVEDPTEFTLAYLADKLKLAGIDVTGGHEAGYAPSASNQATTEVSRHTSIPLSEILLRLNKPSDNLIAECLLKMLGAEKGKEGSAAEGAAVVAAWLKSFGADPAGLVMADGSGVSRYNLVSPRTIATVLKAMATHPQGRLWMDSLPVAGVDGTLRNRLKGTAAEKNVHAKTGSISNASSLSGYVTTKDARRLFFVILMNNQTTESDIPRAVQDKIVTLLATWEATK